MRLLCLVFLFIATVTVTAQNVALPPGPCRANSLSSLNEHQLRLWESWVVEAQKSPLDANYTTFTPERFCILSNNIEDCLKTHRSCEIEGQSGLTA
jgi:hypothetical protein